MTLSKLPMVQRRYKESDRREAEAALQFMRKRSACV